MNNRFFLQKMIGASVIGITILLMSWPISAVMAQDDIVPLTIWLPYSDEVCESVHMRIIEAEIPVEVTCESVLGGTLNEKLIIAAESDRLPDISLVSPLMIPDFYAEGWLQDISMAQEYFGDFDYVFTSTLSIWREE